MNVLLRAINVRALVTGIFKKLKSNEIRIKNACVTISQNALFHRKSLFIIAAGDTNDISLPFVTESISLYFCAHTLFIKNSQLMFIGDFKQFLTSCCRIRYVQLKNTNIIQHMQRFISFCQFI